MPSTYPIAKDKNDRPGSQPICSPTAHLAHPVPHLVGSATPSSRYLSPTQEARIRLWRDHTAPSDALPPLNGKKGIKSAPATLVMPASSPGEPSSSHSRGRGSAPSHTKSRESSSSQRHHHHHHHHHHPPPYRPAVHDHTHSHTRMGSYYSSRKKGSGTTFSPSTTPAPLTPLPLSPPSRQLKSPEQAGPIADQPRMVAKPPEQDVAAQIPPPVIAQPPAAIPRIAGARDPISQNYWRGRFPPVGGPMGINNGIAFMPVLAPGIYPPQAFGMGMGPYG